MNTYERVTYRPEGATRSLTVYLRNPVEASVGGAPAVIGVEVDRFGNLPGTETSVVERRHVISLSLVSRRQAVRIDPTYGGPFVPVQS